MSVYLDAANRAHAVQLGLYAGSSHHRLLGRCAVSRPVAGTWNSCAFAAVRVEKGRSYWTALLQPAGRHARAAASRRLAFRYAAGSAAAHTSWRTTSATLPGHWSRRRRMGGRSAALYASSAFGGTQPKTGHTRLTAAFTIAPEPAVAGQSTVFDGSSSECDRAPCAYSWTDPDDGEVYATGTRFSFTFRSTGTHSVTLTVTDARGRAASTTQSFDVQAADAAPAPTPSPSPTPTASPTPTPTPTGNGCMSNAGACGYPDLGGPDPVGVQAGGIVSQGRNLMVDHVEVDHQGKLGAPGGGDFYAIGTQNYTAQHVVIHNGSDCAGMSGVGVAVNVTITDSLCAVGIDANGDGWPDGGAQHQSNGPLPPNPATPSYCYGGSQHFDGFQSDGGSEITLRHNVIRNPCSQTSAILMSSNTAPISDVTIADNLLAGGGFSLYCAGDPDQSSTTNDNVTGNRVARTYWTEGGYYAPDAYCGTGWTDTWSGNVWDEDGSPLPRNG